MEIIKTLLIYVGLLAAALFSMQYVGSLQNTVAEPKKDKINLALRRTGHLLLKAKGDTTTAIPPVEEIKNGVWRLKLNQHFAYKDLPEILHASFTMHGIQRNYDVAVIRCDDNKIQAGYNLNDYLVNKEVPCQERETNNNCQYIEVSFQKGQASLSSPYQYLWALLTPFAYFLWTRFQKRQTNKRTIPNAIPVEMVAADREPLLQFGAFKLDFTGQKLLYGDTVHSLTYREAKLLHLFVTHANQILERSIIIEKVWADEGVLVGRSVDMFVSRLRKMLKEDATVQIVAVHGIGYRLEILGQNDSIND
ncbi:MAG TPA: winged helix-turn-helix domain-containing protein [Saprospiraceae bacterium]|nr:winged helix-turn-helix domain-containing protein [Saprospiraceae bacterium]